ncbi:MAG: hypothetical protein WC156_11050 [Pedobacter sp.]
MQGTLVEGILKAAASNDDQQLIMPVSEIGDEKNELLFFFKPECFLFDDETHTRAIIEMSLKKLDENKVKVCGAVFFSGNALASLEIMDKHYGYINSMSKTASTSVGENDVKAMKEALNINPAENLPVLGGHEFLKLHPEMNDATLDALWATKKSLRLRSGFYYQAFQIGEQQVIMVNGFHPAQLSHFTKDGRKIVLLVLRSDADWATLKNNLVGDTFPEKADPASIRGELFKNNAKYGVESVTIANNFAHLSAGPFEAYYELNNFLARSTVANYSITQSLVYNKLKSQGLTEELILKPISNPSIKIDSKISDLFSCTENKDTSEAIVVYTQLFK